MAFEGLTVLAVVPARGGSKSIPRKNLTRIAGQSLVARAAAASAAVPWIDRRVLSTDSNEIAEEGQRHGLDVPFRRPEEHAGDRSGSAGMWRHAWLESERVYEMRFDISVLLEPTSPLRRPVDIERTVRRLIEAGAGCAATVSPTPAHFTPHKTLTVGDGGAIGFYLPQGAAHSLRQSIPAYYHRNGICYAATREQVVDRGWILDGDAVGVVIDRPVVNIDDAHELALAEWLLSREEGA